MASMIISYYNVILKYNFPKMRNYTISVFRAYVLWALFDTVLLNTWKHTIDKNKVLCIPANDVMCVFCSTTKHHYHSLNSPKLSVRVGICVYTWNNVTMPAAFQCQQCNPHSLAQQQIHKKNSIHKKKTTQHIGWEMRRVYAIHVSAILFNTVEHKFCIAIYKCKVHQRHITQEECASQHDLSPSCTYFESRSMRTECQWYGMVATSRECHTRVFELFKVITMCWGYLIESQQRQAMAVVLTVQLIIVS